MQHHDDDITNCDSTAPAAGPPARSVMVNLINLCTSYAQRGEYCIPSVRVSLCVCAFVCRWKI